MNSLFSQQQDFFNQNKKVRGRFAPSPSGPLHFGSLVAAVGSYLHAKSNNGLWFVRIEDIDTTRVQPEAQTQILEALVAFGLHWDIDDNTASQLNPDDQGCLKQTERTSRYQEVFDALAANHLLYGCECTRKQIKAAGSAYLGTCKSKSLDMNEHPVRLKQTHPVYDFTDLNFGLQSADKNLCNEDYLIKRRDGLFSYQLAVVIDDIDQGITHVVRGADIMPLTCRQLGLYQTFNVTPPEYLHLPLAVTVPGQKLSKQNHATAINIQHPQPELLKALSFLGLNIESKPDLINCTCEDILQWAIEKVDFSTIPKQLEISI